MHNYLIVGASSGIGKALAELLAEQNRVYGTYRTHKPDSGTINYFWYEANEIPDVSLLPETLDGICYCPGSIQLKPFNRITPDMFLEDYNLQVAGAVRWIQAVLPRLKAAGQASVVLISTVAVQKGFNFHSLVSASKGAVEGLTKALAAEFAPTVRVNCIAPSLTHTPLSEPLLNTPEKQNANAQRHPLKRIGTAGDIAETAAFLLGKKSSWITGQILHVDGGMSTLG